MRSTREHYETHLGPIYSWMSGSAFEARDHSRRLFDELEIAGPGAALDLGGGNGAQAIPLAKLGFYVTAVDFCDVLLDELAGESRALPITIAREDIESFDDPQHSSLDLTVCMGDTLPHLASLEQIDSLVRRVATWLKPGGSFVVTYRDYFSHELTGEKRFIPVRQDPDQLLTCFLEYGLKAETVYDIVDRQINGAWSQYISSYKKTRIDPKWLSAKALSYGLSMVKRFDSQGMLVDNYRKRGAP